jgi:hypothetical protein
MLEIGEYGREILSLFVVFLLLGFTVWKLGYRQGRLRFRWPSFTTRGKAGQRMLSTVERLALTPQHTLHVLRLRGREFVVATHPHGCTLLDVSATGGDLNRDAPADVLARGARA